MKRNLLKRSAILAGALAAGIALGGGAVFLSKQPAEYPSAPSEPDAYSGTLSEGPSYPAHSSVPARFAARDIVKDDALPNMYYFVSRLSPEEPERIMAYDASRSLPSGTERTRALLETRLPADREFRLLGMKGRALVFLETYVEDLPGPCDSPWIAAGLEHLDLSSSTPARVPYRLPDEERLAEMRMTDECLFSIDAP